MNRTIESINSLQNALKLRYFRMNELICNPGQEHLAHEIFSYLNPEDLINCSMVSKSWNKSVKQSRSWWSYKLFQYATEVPFKFEDPDSWIKTVIEQPFLNLFPDYVSVLTSDFYKES